jgi:hypothetical protein
MPVTLLDLDSCGVGRIGRAMSCGAESRKYVSRIAQDWSEMFSPIEVKYFHLLRMLSASGGSLA